MGDERQLYSMSTNITSTISNKTQRPAKSLPWGRIFLVVALACSFAA
jgi:hypothetical protein